MAPTHFSELKNASFWLSVLAEFLGSFLLVLFGCGSCGDGASYFSIALSFGLTVATVVWVIGHVSGGHINPAVTIAFLVTRKISLFRTFFYIIAQCCGATLGAMILRLTYPSWKTSICLTHISVTEYSGFLVEALITFLLVFAVFATCDTLRKGFNGSGPLAIGLSITVGHLWAIKLTGAGTNPARMIGPAIICNNFTTHWIYWIGPFVGGSLAALLYDLVFANNACRDKLKAFFTSKNYDDSDYSTDGANIISLIKETSDIKTASV